MSVVRALPVRSARARSKSLICCILKQRYRFFNYVGEMTGEQIERAILQRVEDLLSQEAGLERNDRVEMLAIVFS
jgi:hypothetical protein